MLRNTFLLEFQLNPLNGLKEGVANFELSLIIWCTHLVSTAASCPENTFISGGETQKYIVYQIFSPSDVQEDSKFIFEKSSNPLKL